jgi:hypothetical protein
MSWLQHFIGIHSVLRSAGMFPTIASMQEAIALVTRFHLGYGIKQAKKLFKQFVKEEDKKKCTALTFQN